MTIDPTTMKYLIQARLEADGVVEKPDVVGAIFGQTEGLLGEELDLRDLQKSGRIGRIEVEVDSRKGRSAGIVYIPSSLDQVETSIMAAALETIDRVGPCKATIKVEKVEDVRVTKRNKIIERAKALLSTMLEDSKATGVDLLDEVRASVQISEIVSYGTERLPAGPNVQDSDSVIIVEGRQDVLNLLRCGIKNAIAVEGTNVPKSVQDLSREKVVTVFLDGDRGGDLILKELLQVAEVDFIARAPRGREVEEMTQKQIMKALRNKIPAEQYVEMYGLGAMYKPSEKEVPAGPSSEPVPASRGPPEHADRPGRPEPFEPEPARAAPMPAPPSRAPVAAEPRGPSRGVAPGMEKYKGLLMEIGGTSKAKIIAADDSVAAEVPVRELVETLKGNGRGAKAVVFDGIITQRILDIASEIGMKAVIGTKMGTVTKQPAGIDVLTRDDLT
ncbi:MAG TPA: DNA primase DnaG [Thermoplasmata archaeon]|jgi:DNA primase|nr:DNA primase DnaG [Thermoplasmata archaeon]